MFERPSWIVCSSRYMAIPQLSFTEMLAGALASVVLALFTPAAGSYQTEVIKVVELTYPPGSSDIPISRWTIEAWLEKNKSLPTSLSVCTSVFVKAFVADWSTFIDLFRLEDEHGVDWAVLRMSADYKMTKLKVRIGPKDEVVEVAPTKSLPIYFPQSWIRACISLDLENGVARIAANGEMLEDVSYPDLMKLKTKRPGKFTIRVGKGWFGGQHAKWTDLNMFSKPLEPQTMLAMTSSGNDACGTSGDFLKWADTQWSHSTKWATGYDWNLVINASKVVDLAFEEGPCWRKAGIHVYAFWKVHHHSDCIRHCRKIGGGRVPSVVSSSQWEDFQLEIESVTPNHQRFNTLWLAATQGYDGPSFDMGHKNSDTAF